MSTKPTWAAGKTVGKTGGRLKDRRENSRGLQCLLGHPNSMVLRCWETGLAALNPVDLHQHADHMQPRLEGICMSKASLETVTLEGRGKGKFSYPLFTNHSNKAVHLEPSERNAARLLLCWGSCLVAPRRHFLQNHDDTSAAECPNGDAHHSDRPHLRYRKGLPASP